MRHKALEGQSVNVSQSGLEILIRSLGANPSEENRTALESLAVGEGSMVAVPCRRAALAALPSPNRFTEVGDASLAEATIVRFANYLPMKRQTTDKGIDFREMVRGELDQYNVDRQTLGAKEAFNVLRTERLKLLMDALGFQTALRVASDEILRSPDTARTAVVLGMSGIPSDPQAEAARIGLQRLFDELQTM